GQQPPPGPGDSCPAGVTITVAKAGSAYGFTATGYTAGDQLSAAIVQLPSTTPVASLTTNYANSAGQVNFSWTPSATTAAGNYAIVVTGPGNCTKSQSFQVNNGLSNTGPRSITNVLGLIGLLALGLGGISLVGRTCYRRAER
ncbi:MAG: hypothetical protein LBL92_04530, partial [Propionibacteriaceae bacterium]|nr:hypothetical protein [Propionibacteriaceae bacterium]